MPAQTPFSTSIIFRADIAVVTTIFRGFKDTSLIRALVYSTIIFIIANDIRVDAAFTGNTFLCCAGIAIIAIGWVGAHAVPISANIIRSA